MDVQPIFQQEINNFANYLEAQNAPGIIAKCMLVVTGIIVLRKIFNSEKLIRKIRK